MLFLSKNVSFIQFFNQLISKKLNRMVAMLINNARKKVKCSFIFVAALNYTTIYNGLVPCNDTMNAMTVLMK